MHVQTATEPLAVGDMGVTLTHEHLVIGWPGWHLDPRNRDARAAAVRRCAAVAGELREHGVQTIIDPCPAELGRDAELAAEVSQRSGLNVILATGLYTEESGLLRYQRSMSIDDLCEVFLQELQEGIGRTGIRPGVIKCAAGPLIAGSQAALTSPAEERVLRAAARASALTGAPVIAHNDERRPAGRVQARVMSEEGADPRRLVVGHADGVGDLRYYLKVLATGARLAFDRFGLESATSDTQRIAALAGLAAAGYADQLLISTDAAMAWLGRPGDDLAAAIERCPGWTAAHLLADVVPALRRAGLAARTVERMLTSNAAALFRGPGH